jgi:thymidylate synthase, flavin-dependent
MEDKSQELNVQLMEHTHNAATLIYSICKQCNSPDGAADIFFNELRKDACHEIFMKNEIGLAPNQKSPAETRNDLIRKVIASGHSSVVEHVSFTFGITGFSRISSQQVTRHRIGMAVTQQSQRETNAENFTYVVPPHILEHEDTRTMFFEEMRHDQERYSKMLHLLEGHGYKKQSCQEDARFLLSNACETKFVLTFNARALLHFIELRNCRKAQWEVRALSNKLLSLVNPILPAVFDTAGAPCERFGFCTEDRSCGRYPSLKDLTFSLKEG